MIPNLYEIQEKAIFLVQIKNDEISKLHEELKRQYTETEEFLNNRIDLT